MGQLNTACCLNPASTRRRTCSGRKIALYKSFIVSTNRLRLPQNNWHNLARTHTHTARGSAHLRPRSSRVAPPRICYVIITVLPANQKLFLTPTKTRPQFFRQTVHNERMGGRFNHHLRHPQARRSAKLREKPREEHSCPGPQRLSLLSLNGWHVAGAV